MSNENENVDKTYTVIWRMTVNARNRREAAELAREIQLDKDSIATVFDVYQVDARDTIEIDLMKEVN